MRLEVCTFPQIEVLGLKPTQGLMVHEDAISLVILGTR